MGTYRVPRVVRMYRDRSVSKHSFGSGGGNDNFFVCKRA